MADISEKEIIHRFDGLRQLTPDRDAVQAAVEKAKAAIIQGRQDVTNKPFFQSTVFKFAVAACLVAAVFAGFVLLTNDKGLSPEVAKNTDRLITDQKVDPVAGVTAKEEKLAEMEKLFAAGDTKGLLAMLDDGDEEIRNAVAKLLAEIGGADLIETLTELSLAFEGSGPDPYRLALTEMEDLGQQEVSTEQTAPEADEEQEEEPEIERPFTVGVTNKHTSAPIGGALVKIDVYSTDRWDKSVKEAVTDADGHALFDIGAERVVGLYVGVEKAGFVCMSYYTTEAWRLANMKDFSVKLDEGVEFGGTVVNEQNEPVEGASLDMRVVTVSPGTTIEPVRDFRVVKTDEFGRWTARAVRSDLAYTQYKLNHPEYVDDKYPAKLLEYFPGEQYLAGEAVFVMLKGHTVTGYVHDSDGHPIEGADVYDGQLLRTFDGQLHPNPDLRDRTDIDGMFELHNAVQGRMLLSAEAKGYAPYAVNINVTPDSDPLWITLDNSSVINGRVVDVNGEPLEGASVRNVSTGTGSVPVNWEAKTDANGRFVWEDAPPEQVKLQISLPNYYRLITEVSPDPERENEFVLSPGLIVRGNVYDAATNEPVNNFKLTPGFTDNPDRGVYYQQSLDMIQEFDGGNYEYVAIYGKAFGFKITAEGYASSESRLFDAEEEEAVFDVYLERADSMQGTVYDAQGIPVEGADVYVLGKRRILQFDNFLNTNKMLQPVKTDSDGRFGFTQEDEKFLIVAMHDDKGFVEVGSEDFENSHAIYLSQWGKLEGVAYIGSEFASNADIRVDFNKNYDPERGNYSFRYDVKTDSEGKFSVDKLIADQATDASNRVSRVVKTGAQRSEYVDTKTAEVLPGETTYIVLGGEGRKVTGKLVKPAGYSGDVSWSASRGNIRTASVDYSSDIFQQIFNEFEHPLPAGYNNMTAVEVMTWLRQWEQTDEGKAFNYEIQQRLQELSGGSEQRTYTRYPVAVYDDGTFEAYNVERGSYIIEITVYGNSIYGSLNYNNPIGKTGHKFAMPEITDDNIDEPLDVGYVALETTGALSGLIKLKDYNSNSIDLDSYRGKLLLITYWHLDEVLSESQDSGMDAIKQLQDELAADDRIEMLGVTTSEMPWSFYTDLRLKYLEEKGITFNQAIIVEAGDILRRQIQQSGYPLPVNVLIDTNGNVISAGLKGQELEEAVNAALEN